MLGGTGSEPWTRPRRGVRGCSMVLAVRDELGVGSGGRGVVGLGGDGRGGAGKTDFVEVDGGTQSDRCGGESIASRAPRLAKP